MFNHNTIDWEVIKKKNNFKNIHGTKTRVLELLALDGLIYCSNCLWFNAEKSFCRDRKDEIKDKDKQTCGNFK